MKHIRKSIIPYLTIIFVFLALFISCPKTQNFNDEECDWCGIYTIVMLDYFSGNTGDSPDFTKWVNDCTNDSTADIQNNSMAFYGGSNQFEYGALAVKDYPSNSKTVSLFITVKYDVSSDFFISLSDTSDDEQYIVSYIGLDITLSAINSSNNLLNGWVGSYAFNTVTHTTGDWLDIIIYINSSNIKVQIVNSSLSNSQTITHAISSDLPFSEIDKIAIGGGEDMGGSRKSYFDFFSLRKNR